MRHLIIKNVGPIKSIDVELCRFNFIIGPQSSGKSTIAKVMSTCEWIEKEVATTLDSEIIGDGEAFRILIEKFHKMYGYFVPDSYIEYDTDVIKLKYENGNLKISLNDDAQYTRQKISYIPAERNMVTLPELDGFEFKSTNLKSFLFDWWRAREAYTPDNKTEVLSLGYKYCYDKKRSENRDRILHSNGVTYDISLSDSSSGLQSITPLYVMLQYYSDQYFREYDIRSSYKDDTKLNKMRKALMEKYILRPIKKDFKVSEIKGIIDEFNNRLNMMDEGARTLYESYQNAMTRLTVPDRITYIIEEPEQNLFPDAQIQLINYILHQCTSERKHCCTITTHSPYILFALNNCIMGGIVGNDVPEKTKKTIQSNMAWISPDLVSIYEVQNGGLVRVQDEDGLLEDNYLNKSYKALSSEYLRLLQHYETKAED